MDYRKLAGVSNQLSGKAVAIVDDLRISQNENPLNALTIDQPKRIQDNTKYLILDNEAITSIMTAPRDKRRNLLSKLTDSQRARVLSQWDSIKSLQKVKDDDFESKLALTGIDTLISNFIVNPTDFNRSALEEPIESQSGAVKEFAESVLSSTTLDEVPQELASAYSDFLSSQGIKSAAVEALSVYKPVEESNYEPDDTLVLTPEVQQDIEQSADTLFADSAKFSKSPLSLIEDAISVYVKQGYDYYQVADTFSLRFTKFLSKRVSDSSNSSIKRVFDDAIKALNSVEDKPFIDEQGKEVQPTEDKSILTLLDEALNDYAEGNSDKLDTLLSSTIATAEESSEDQLVESDSSLEESQETDESQLDEPSDKDNIKDSEESIDADEQIGVSQCPYQTIKDKVADLVLIVVTTESSEEMDLAAIADLAKSILTAVETIGEEPTPEDCIQFASQVKNNTVDNKLLDSLKPFVPSLSKYNFRKSDCAIAVSECSEPVAPVADIPMTHDEYYSLSQPLVPCYFGELVSQSPKCPVVNSIEPLPEERSFLVNGACKYTPYDIPFSSFEELIANTPKESLNKIVDLHCCAVEDAFHFAAMTNSLSFIDSKFYKKHLSDSKWYFDEVPAILKDFTTTPGSLSYGAVEDSSKNVQIGGYSYYIS